MKTKLTIALLLVISITGCHKQQTEAPKSDDAIKVQFEKSDDQIGKYLAKLDNPDITQSEKNPDYLQRPSRRIHKQLYTSTIEASA